MAAGSIIIDLLMRTGSFSTDTDRAAKDLAKLKKEAYATGKALGDTFQNIAGALGLTVSIGGLAMLVKSSIDAADHLNDLSKATGVAVDTLGGIGFAASQAGGDLDSASQALGKLNLKLAEARRGDKEAVDLFKSMGLEDLVKNGASVDQVFAALADKFNEYEDGPEKAALGNAIFGKSYQQLLPLLSEGGAALQENIDYYKRYGGVTAETAKQADEFNDVMGKLSLLTSSFGHTLAGELMQPLKAVAEELLSAKENSDLFSTAAAAVRTVLETVVVLGANVAFVFKSAGREIGGMAAQLAALMRGDFTGFRAISDAMKEDAARARAELEDFERRVMDRTPRAGPTTGDFARRDREAQPGGKKAPKLQSNRTGGGGDANAALKRQLDAEIKEIRAFAQQQAQGFEFAERYLEGVYADGLISLKDYFDAKHRVREAGVQAQLAAIDKEIAAEEKAAGKLKGKGQAKDRAEIEGRIAEAKAKRDAIGQKAGQEAILGTQQETRALKALADSYDDLRAKALELSGDIQGATEIRIKKDAEAARALITATGGDPADADQYEDLLRKTAQLSQAQSDYNALLEQASRKEEEILLAAQETGATELETLRAVRAAREQSLDQLGRLADEARRLADELKTPEAEAFADQLALAFRRAALEVDPLLLKLREGAAEVGQSIAANLGDLVTQKGKGVREVLRGIYDDLLAIATRRFITEPLADQLTKALGGVGESGGLLGKLFGVGKEGKDAKAAGGTRALDDKSAAVATSLTSLQTQGIEPTIAALLRFRAALDSGMSPTGLPEVAGSTTGDFARMDRVLGGSTEELTTGDFSRADRANDKAIAEESKRSIEGLGMGASQAASVIEQLAQAAGKGGSALSILPSIIRMIELAGLSGGKGGGGLFGMVGSFVSGVAGWFKGGSSAGAISSAGTGWGSVYAHDGGVIGRDWLRKDDPHERETRLKPNERRAVLEVGEEVITRDDPRHRDNAGVAMLGERKFHDGGVVGRTVGGVFSRSAARDASISDGGGVNVQIVNNGAPATATASTERGPDGRQLLKITMKAIEADIAAGGRVGKAMESQYGLRRNLPRRD